MTEDEVYDLGASVARQVTWDGDVIMMAFLVALTDANFHTLRERIEDTYKQYLKENSDD